MRRLVLCVEGESEEAAAPALVSRLWIGLPPEVQMGFVDSKPLRVKSVSNLTGRCSDNWKRYLQAASQRPNCGGVLLLLDAEVWEDDGGCAIEAARTLATESVAVGGGKLFSVAVVLFRKEFESLLIASYPHLPGHRVSVVPPGTPELAPRDAKKWLKQNLEGGYKEKTDQVILTRAINLEHLRKQNLHSFQRLEHAVLELATAMTTDQHIVSPRHPTPESS